MQGQGTILIVPALMLATAACTSSSLPTLPQPQPPPVPQADVAQAPAEAALIVPGTPTEIYALVARGALRCWLGADGPLKPTHVFHAEAEPPAKGGLAEIVLHERDETMGDKRGARAFQVGFSGVPAGVRVAVTVPKMERQLARAMTKDVAVWAKGGTDCEVRAQLPPPPVAPVSGKRDSTADRKR